MSICVCSFRHSVRATSLSSVWPPRTAAIWATQFHSVGARATRSQGHQPPLSDDSLPPLDSVDHASRYEGRGRCGQYRLNADSGERWQQSQFPPKSTKIKGLEDRPLLTGRQSGSQLFVRVAVPAGQVPKVLKSCAATQGKIQWLCECGGCSHSPVFYS